MGPGKKRARSEKNQPSEQKNATPLDLKTDTEETTVRLPRARRRRVGRPPSRFRHDLIPTNRPSLYQRLQTLAQHDNPQNTVIRRLFIDPEVQILRTLLTHGTFFQNINAESLPNAEHPLYVSNRMPDRDVVKLAIELHLYAKACQQNTLPSGQAEMIRLLEHSRDNFNSALASIKLLSIQHLDILLERQTEEKINPRVIEEKIIAYNTQLEELLNQHHYQALPFVFTSVFSLFARYRKMMPPKNHPIMAILLHYTAVYGTACLVLQKYCASRHHEDTFNLAELNKILTHTALSAAMLHRPQERAIGLDFYCSATARAQNCQCNNLKTLVEKGIASWFGETFHGDADASNTMITLANEKLTLHAPQISEEQRTQELTEIKEPFLQAQTMSALQKHYQARNQLMRLL